MPGAHWLPERHLGVAATLAHVDEAIATIGDLLFEYQARGGDVVHLREVVDGPLRHLVVDSIAPIPPKVSLLAADAFNDLRAAIEHTIFVEAELSEGSELDEGAARLVEMPASYTDEAFGQWNRKQAKKGPTALRDGAELNRRIYGLQPLHRYTDPAAHPLARLVAYTNHSKHRTPAVTAVQIPIVNREDTPLRHPRDVPKRPQGPILPGEVIFTAPGDRVVPVAIFPTVGINIPGTDRWPVLMNELGDIAAWVRTQAVPRLITGTDPPSPVIPAWYDISHGHPDARAAVGAGRAISAFDRNKERMGAAVARGDIAEVIAAMDGAPPLADVSAWLESLSDSDFLARMGQIVPSFDHDPDDMLHNWGVLQAMSADAAAHAQSRTSATHPVTAEDVRR